MKLLRVIVEMPVLEGDFSEGDLRFVVERLLGDADMHHELKRYGRLKSGRVRVKAFTRVEASGAVK